MDKSSFNSNEEEFLKYMKPYYDLGLLKDIIVTDEYRVCNYCNHSYIWFPYHKQEDNSQVGLPFGSRTLRCLYEDENYILKLLNSKDGSKYIDCLNAYSNQIIKKQIDFQKKYENNPKVDLELEEEILSKQKEK